MASERVHNDEAAQGAQADAPNTFTLQVVSPSVAIPHGRLTFPGTAMNMTVKQLKEKIRQSLDAKPSDQTQRLISRGRLLSRENETMQEIFGDSLRTMDCQTLHLVLREANTSTPDLPYPASLRPTASASPRLGPNEHMHTHHHHHHDQPPVQGPQNRPTMPWANLTLGPTQAMNLPFGLNPQQIAQQQRQWASTLSAQLANAQVEQQRLQELLNQSQRERAAMGLNGVQDGQTPNARPAPTSQNPGRTASPFQQDNNTRTVVREGVAPNGQQWRITVNETVSGPGGFPRDPRTGAIILPTPQPGNAAFPPRPGPASQLSGVDVQNILRAADAGQAATRVMTDAMRRNASTSSLPNLSSSQSHRPIPPGVTTPLNPSPARSANATPDFLRIAGQNMRAPTSQPQTQPLSSPPELYILSSPEGPRAILVHGNLGTYYTPQSIQVLNPVMALPRVPWTSPGMQIGPSSPAVQPPGTQETTAPLNQPQPQGQHVPDPQGLPPLPQQQQQQQPQNVAGQQPQHVQVRLQVRAVALGALWPHIWMVIRLLLFIWWFLSPDASWSRWLTVISIAIALFLVNTGLLNPLAEQIRVPLRRHLENLMPLADGQGRAHPPPAAGAGDGNAQDENGFNANPQGPPEPNPADTAARLVQQRRQANANWLMAQARRLERAGILFLASIAPGVAERHIAHLEAAERQRQEAEAAAAAAAEAARNAAESGEAAAEDAEAADQNPSASATGAEPEPAAEEGEGVRRREAHEAPAEPLVAI